MSETNPDTRLEAFCDGVFAIALTLLIIEIRPPAVETIDSTAALWHALQHLAPSVFAFVLSFAIILVTWVNHHGFLRMVVRSTPSFVYANGFLLLTVVIVPFPTALLGEFIWTDHAAPAVVLYNAVWVLQAIAWMLMIGAAVGNDLLRGAREATLLRENRRHSYVAAVLYSALAVMAFWLPAAVALITTATWIFWLVLSIRMKRSEDMA